MPATSATRSSSLRAPVERETRTTESVFRFARTASFENPHSGRREKLERRGRRFLKVVETK